ncbi:MAG: tetratricopeptide repeat protein [Yoonia sp.]|uniref:tetratricopeptide repeat protein n=1 Tax=Yoonia sp. TaxID=2212373 RepID=UPI003EFAD305
MKLSIPFLLLATPAVAQGGCPPPTDHSAQMAEIIGALQQAETEMEARVISQDLWGLWLDAPDAVAQAMLDEGMAKRGVYDFLGARQVLGRLIAYCPDYAEGYNQRAFASFLARDFEAALADLDQALAIMPTHVAALSGKALTLMGLGRNDEAQDVLRAALELNPWLQERALLVEPDGTKL